MGVPGFFSWLQQNHKNNSIILDSIPVTPDVLYLDANCLFHPQAFLTIDQNKNWDDKYILEGKIIKSILDYIDSLINIVKPNLKLYIAVDGAAPMAKVNQQRKRRFRAHDDNIIRSNIKKKHNIPISNYWNNSAITPGTEFMERLHLQLVDFCKTIKVKYSKLNPKFNLVYSSYHTAGEGEHKILQDIKVNKNKNIFVYGLDADLIFLSLASQVKNIYLMREKNFFDNNSNTNDNSFNYVSIDSMINSINSSMNGINSNNNTNTNYDFTKDFIFICYMLGNDFIPNLPSVHIRTDGLNFLINKYLYIFNGMTDFLIKNDNSINSDFLYNLLFEISKYEDYYFREILTKYKLNQQTKDAPAHIKDQYHYDIWELENMRYNIIEDTVKLGSGYPEQYKNRFYTNYKYDNNSIKDMCREYLVSLNWITKYYFDKCSSWSYFYPYIHAPFVTDLVKYYVDIDTSSYIDKSMPLAPCTQLLVVTPPVCVDLLPTKYKQLILDPKTSIAYMYPTNVILDTFNKFMYHECVPLIPNIDISKILDEIKDIKLLKKDKIKDSILEDIVF